MKAFRKQEVVDYFRYGVDPLPDWFLELPRETVFDADGRQVDDFIDATQYTIVETPKQSVKVYKYEYLIKDEHGNLMTLCKDVFNMVYGKLSQINRTISDELISFANDLCNETLEATFENRGDNLKYISLCWDVTYEQHHITDFICEKLIHKVQGLQDDMILKELRNDARDNVREITLLYIEY